MVDHIPRAISRFCKFFLDYGGQIHATVTSSKFRRSPLPQGGLEIPMRLINMQADTSDEVFLKMKELLNAYCMEPDKISVVSKKTDDFELLLYVSCIRVRM